LTLTNKGSDLEPGIPAGGARPDGATYVRHTGGGTYNLNTGVWSVASLAKGGSRSLKIEARVVSTSDLTSTAAITHVDPKPLDADGDHDGDNTASEQDDESPPDPQPFWVVADPRGQYLYVSDYAAAVVYVVDINPFDASYHRVVQRIHLPDAPLDAAGHEVGLREIALSSDGRRLFVTAPDRTYPGGDRLLDPQNGARQSDSKIYVIDTDPAETRYFLKVLGTVDKRAPLNQPWQETYGIAATSRPDLMIFTDRENTQGDNQSEPLVLGVIHIEDDDPAHFTATASAKPLEFNPYTRYLNVNNPEGVVVTKDLKYGFVAGFNKYRP